MTTALQTQVGLTPYTKSSPPPLFDKGTHHLVKIEDTDEHVYIFSLPRGVLPTYSNAMKEGDIIAFRINKEDRYFRQPFTDAKLDEYTYTFNFLKKIPVGDTAKTFYRRIEKILNPDAKAILLRGSIKGADKLKDLQIDAQATAVDVPKIVNTWKESEIALSTTHTEPTGELPVLYRGKALTKIGDYFYRYDVQTCIHCGGLINTQSQVQVKDGRGVAQTTKKAVYELDGHSLLDTHAHRVAGSRSEWEHDACREEKAGTVPVEEHPEPIAEASLQLQSELDGGIVNLKSKDLETPPSPTQELAAKTLEVLGQSATTSEWKLGYLTAFFEWLSAEK